MSSLTPTSRSSLTDISVRSRMSRSFRSRAASSSATSSCSVTGRRLVVWERRRGRRLRLGRWSGPLGIGVNTPRGVESDTGRSAGNDESRHGPLFARNLVAFARGRWGWAEDIGRSRVASMSKCGGVHGESRAVVQIIAGRRRGGRGARRRPRPLSVAWATVVPERRDAPVAVRYHSGPIFEAGRRSQGPDHQSPLSNGPWPDAASARYQLAPISGMNSFFGSVARGPGHCEPRP